MKSKKTESNSLTFLHLNPSNWSDFETLFGERGACGGCWCMSWRLKTSEYKKNKGIGNKKFMMGLVEKSEETGLIFYINAEPIAWCSVAPRNSFIKLENSRVLKRIDDKPVWSIVCLFIRKDFRRKGLSVKILNCVVEYCKSKKVEILEAYPIIPYSSKIPDAFAWTGFLTAYEKAGFIEAARISPARPIMRYYL
ncbi:MAG: GNAT family N-acetyltransferase [Ignavibacteriales bacterium]|nr:GNAT family N-acetyltransferase [Ignavibacteriales bacterium]